MTRWMIKFIELICKKSRNISKFSNADIILYEFYSRKNLLQIWKAFKFTVVSGAKLNVMQMKFKCFVV